MANTIYRIVYINKLETRRDNKVYSDLDNVIWSLEKEEFKKIFLEVDIPDDNITIAEKNLQLANLKAAARMAGPNARVNYRNYINNKTNQLYSLGQIPPNNYLNPVAWYKFIKAWRNGVFKTDKKINEAIKEQEKTDRKRWDYDEWIEKN